MTLAAGFKFEHPKAAGVSSILLMSDSRYSLSSGEVYRDDGKKIWAVATNMFAAFAGNVYAAQRGLETVTTRLAQSSAGSFDDLISVLTSSFDLTMIDADPQQPHFIVAAMASDGSSRLLYARPHGGRYEVFEKTSVVIGLTNLEPILRAKIDRPALRAGAWHPKHFMAHPDWIFRNDDHRRQQALQDASDISAHIGSQFLEVVDDPNVIGANPPLQTLLLMPGGARQIDLYEISGIAQIARKTAHASEVAAEADLCSGAVVELNVWN